MARLRRDRRGNTLAMMAAMLVPMAALAGSAIEMSRLYFVKVRLQQACDAGALAGRKFMTGTTLDANAKAQADAFFANNFRTGTFGASDVVFTPSALQDGQVYATSAATVPMTLMRMFGKSNITVSVECQAKLEIPNLDLMFVLDTTGSMADTNAGDSASKITALRSSVTDFYTAIETSKQSGTQVRYGFVPYATTVNVGALLKKEWMVDKWTYQSRIPDGTEQVPGSKTTGAKTITDSTAWVTNSGNSETIISYLPLESCTAPANTNKSTDVMGPKSTSTQPNGDVWTSQTRTRTTTGSSYAATITGGKCKLTETRYNNLVQERTETTKPNPNAGVVTEGPPTTRYWWSYQPVEYDVSGLKGGTMMTVNNSVIAPVANNHANRTVKWAGCIEERDTVRQVAYPSIPTGAYDMNIDLVPTTDAKTQWRPALSGLVFVRKSLTSWSYANVRDYNNYTNIADYMSGFYASCPSAARKLAAITAANLKTYLDGLTVSGNTYHDIGFLWGARLLSKDGIFSSENQSPASGEISRHLIFMTDGETDTDIINYEAYGLSALDRRRTDAASLPTDAGQNTIVENRLKALCTATKNKNITVWVIAFGISLNDMLRSCASTGRAYEAKNNEELKQTFSKIASQIAQLRVAK